MIKDLVSVLVPCYQHEKYVLDTLKSIQNSLYPLIEVIYIDDGSSDDSYDIACEYFAKHGYSYYNYICIKQENQGITKVLNRMLSMSQGEYITIVASDDMLTENGISDRVNYLKNNPEKMAVIGKAFQINESGGIINADAGLNMFGMQPKMLSSKHINKEIILRWGIVGPVLLLKKSAYDTLGYYDETLKVEDRDFYLRLVAHSGLIYLGTNVAYYRTHASNSSKRTWFAKRKNVLLESAKVNLSYSECFSDFFERTYLKSYSIDRFLIDKNLYTCLLWFKIFRKLLVKLIMLPYGISLLFME